MSDERTHIDEATLSGEIKTYLVDPGTGNKLTCAFRDPTESERKKLAELQAKASEDGDEEAAAEFEELIIDDLFQSDKITSDSTMALKQAVIAALFRALGDNDAIKDAKELVQTSGNP